MSSVVKHYLTERQELAESADIAQAWAELEDLYTRKLWHQLTLRLKEFVKSDYFQRSNGLLQLYEKFLSDFEHRINALSLVEIILYVKEDIEDPNAAVEFLERINEKVKDNTEARVLCNTAIGTIKLQQGNLGDVKKLIEETEAMLDTVSSVSFIHAQFFNLCSKFHATTSYADYYRDSLRYLGCVDLVDVSVVDQQERAFRLGIAAILGDGVYNFGELLAHPVLESLKGTENDWLVSLLYAFNSGDIGQFELLKSHWQKQEDLVKNETKLFQKIQLLSVMELTFKRPSTNRSIPFEVIAEAARIPISQVELLVMKALSLGLVKGSIDEISKQVNMTWVQPRVLDLSQIKDMADRLSTWCKSVKETVHSMEDQVPELLA
ncbi:26S proteasome non-ATPase regulatory subunit 13-like [Corticium candelabrum]|uniref:26S proteasome non-ATPase regulatory subunit 13-like n=1 Tax=Corticium candelabrum TaxID=121492 RepID=UPI002E274181|nr:26S proteasome non-ATPase regulatory subunit 13-like [Corticium candelabrum]